MTQGDIEKNCQADASGGIENTFCAKIPKQVLVWCCVARVRLVEKRKHKRINSLVIRTIEPAEL